MVVSKISFEVEKLFLIIGILLATFIASKAAKFLVDRAFKRASAVVKVDYTHYSFMKHLLSFTIYIIGIGFAAYTIPSLHDVAVSIFASAGILAVIIGFASQQAFANVVSGIFIVIFKPFRVGDNVKIGSETQGIIEDITLRHTVIRDFKNKRVIIPNSIINNETIENSSYGDKKICKWFEVGISYDADIDRAMKIIQLEAKKHPDFYDNRTAEQKEAGKPAIDVRVINLGDFAVTLRAYIWAKSPGAGFRISTDLNKKIKERFDEEGIEIPFPYRTVVYKKDLPKRKR